MLLLAPRALTTMVCRGPLGLQRRFSVTRGALTDADPADGMLHLARVCRVIHQFGDVFSVLDRDLAPAEPRDEAQYRRPLVTRVERRLDLCVQDATVVRRSERVIPIDDADRLEARQNCLDLLGRKGPEPLESDEADLLAFRPETAHQDAH